jgi:hypothetical protein
MGRKGRGKEKRAEKGKRGDGKGREGGDREKSTPHQKILDPPLSLRCAHETDK